MTQRFIDFQVGGLQPLTMIDFPGRLAAVIFAQGCNFRCRFCYNRTLLPDRARDMLEWNSIIEFLKDRQGFIEGVVFSGGEPCRQESFVEALEQVRDLGFETALHTNGYYLEPVETALKLRLLNYIAVDCKTTLSRYQEVTGESFEEERWQRLLAKIVASGVRHEIRTTVHPEIVTENEVMQMAEQLAAAGIEKFVLQKFQHGEALDRKLAEIGTIGIRQANLLRLRSIFPEFEIRGDAGIEISFKERKTA
jgi:pyruvate formate lyase activating enzyme